MPMVSVLLRPGVNTQRTLSLNEAGVSISQLIRYKDQIIQTYGGWSQFITTTIPSTVRDLHAWQDAASVKHLGVAATSNLMVVTLGSATDITPQTAVTNFSPNFTSSNGSNIIIVTDNNSSGLPSVFNTVFFNTPVSISGILLNGAYDILTVTSSITYTIRATKTATSNVISSGILPIFNTSSGSGSVLVTLPNNGFVSRTGIFYSFIAPTSVGGLTIQGPYQIQTIIDSTSFRINATTTASGTAQATMNSSRVQLAYYVTLGPQSAGSGFGAGGFGSGGFGTGTPLTGTQGTPITTTDWTMDNWGSVLLACPKDGPIYSWSPDNGFATAQVISEAPFFNGGIFVSMPQQILVAWRSCLPESGTQDNLTVRWCDAEDFTNWTISNQTAAGSFKIPTGSLIVGGLQGPTQGILWTDIDVWAMQYIGGTLVFNFNRIGSGCGLVGPHAAGTLSGNVFWMGPDNFFMMSGEGAAVLPCTVWDFVFQNIDMDNISKVRCATNAAFNEVKWFFPSATSNGENDSYVKFNIVEKEWDHGALPRTAWTDVSILGDPIGADPSGVLYQHETGNATPGVSNPSFQTGWWSITEGNDIAFVDFAIPDFKFGTYSEAQNANIQITFFSVNYPGDAVVSQGPYTVNSTTQFLSPRIRGRLMSVLVQGDGLTFMRLGRIRYRWALAGRR